MKNIFFIILFLFLISSVARADWLYPDGHEWNSWEKKEKIHFINGFMNGANSVAISYFTISIEIGKTPEQFITAFAFDGISVGQLLDGIDLLYSDFKNRSIAVFFALYVVKKQVKGTPPEDIERILLWMRARVGSTGSLMLKDSKGKIIFP